MGKFGGVLGKTGKSPWFRPDRGWWSRSTSETAAPRSASFRGTQHEFDRLHHEDDHVSMART